MSSGRATSGSDRRSVEQIQKEITQVEAKIKTLEELREIIPGSTQGDGLDELVKTGHVFVGTPGNLFPPKYFWDGLTAEVDKRQKN